MCGIDGLVRSTGLGEMYMASSGSMGPGVTLVASVSRTDPGVVKMASPSSTDPGEALFTICWKPRSWCN